MAVCSLLVIFVLLCIDTASGVGHLGIMARAHRDVCYYRKIEEAHFSYDEEDCRGPENWCRVHKCWTACGSNRRQSPINLDTSEARTKHSLTNEKDFADKYLRNLHKRPDSIIFNNGHAPPFAIRVDKNNVNNNIILTNVPQRPAHKKYIFAELHVHLGENKREGSEHSIDDKFYPMEAHMVFYDSDAKDRDITFAKFQEDGLVVLGVMIEVKREDDDDDDGDDEEVHKCECEKDRDHGHHHDHHGHHHGHPHGHHGHNHGHQHSYHGHHHGHHHGHPHDGDNKVCHRRNYGDYHHKFKRRCYHGHGRCKVRFAKTLSNMMTTYYEKIKDYHAPSEDSPALDPPERIPCGRKRSEKFIIKNCIKDPEVRKNVTVECGVSPLDALPYDGRFYTYKGSLTTPPCYETVQWIVFKCPIKVSRKAFEALRHVEDAGNRKLPVHGVQRPLQNNRETVYKNFY